MACAGAGLGEVGERAMEGDLAGMVESNEAFEKEASEQGAEYPDRQEETRTRCDPKRSVRRETAAGHVHVDVGMVGHRRAPSVQHGNEADAGAEVFGIGSDARRRLCGSPEQQIKDGLLVLEGDDTDLGGQRERRGSSRLAAGPSGSRPASLALPPLGTWGSAGCGRSYRRP
jgi:hypothetical protein